MSRNAVLTVYTIEANRKISANLEIIYEKRKLLNVFAPATTR